MPKKCELETVRAVCGCDIDSSSPIRTAQQQAMLESTLSYPSISPLRIFITQKAAVQHRLNWWFRQLSLYFLFYTCSAILLAYYFFQITFPRILQRIRTIGPHLIGSRNSLQSSGFKSCRSPCSFHEAFYRHVSTSSYTEAFPDTDNSMRVRSCTCGLFLSLKFCKTGKVTLQRSFSISHYSFLRKSFFKLFFGKTNNIPDIIGISRLLQSRQFGSSHALGRNVRWKIIMIVVDI